MLTRTPNQLGLTEVSAADLNALCVPFRRPSTALSVNKLQDPPGGGLLGTLHHADDVIVSAVETSQVTGDGRFSLERRGSGTLLAVEANLTRSQRW